MEKWCCKKRPKTLNVIEAIKNANMQKKNFSHFAWTIRIERGNEQKKMLEWLG